MKSVYLDHAASTPVHPEVAERMMNVMTSQYGNASSVHAFGREAKKIVNGARDRIASLLGCHSDELVFTAGGTESDNLAVLGLLESLGVEGRHVITSAVEHHAVLHTCHELERRGCQVTYVPVDPTGRVSVEDIAGAIQDNTALVTIMYGNNEVGTVQPIAEIGELCRSRGIVFHTDAVQALGSEAINCRELPVDMWSFSAHKINGPQGVGALVVRRGLSVSPRLFGGLQEKKRRAGTENMAGIAGFAAAVEWTVQNMETRIQHYRELRSTLLDGLRQEIGENSFVINGNPEHHLPHILNISFPGANTETMLMNLDMEGIAAASGSACTSGSLEISHVLRAMKLSDPVLRSAIRFSFGLGNTTQEMEYTAQKIGTILNRLRK
ncbi:MULTISPECIES: cysteine desulfurase family protein [Bacillales]|uniref:cysteine desulfurase family protein n=1 Tax=Bacillales TaxID=1385 RepID=UPI000BBDE46E|nr:MULTISPECIES: cysteine desulfurase family protein [Paenibacillus]PCL94152.1 cysteine desulfurase NifS [Paenibacillus lautus]QOT07961.1 cysteine desulfurase [Paenibacillus sp. JNUCC-32]WFB60258.1 cysteine desulfurase family protein [Paenibacillus sp. BR1-192]